MSKVLAVLTPARRGDALIHEAIRVASEGDSTPEMRVIYGSIKGVRHLKDCLNNRGLSVLDRLKTSVKFPTTPSNGRSARPEDAQAHDCTAGSLRDGGRLG